MALSVEPYVGARDFYPKDERVQAYMRATMRRVAETFGYEAYDAPLLEPADLYATTTSAEIADTQLYTFADRGGHRLAIRPDMTPSTARLVAAKRSDLTFPLRWYSLLNLWRYEQPQQQERSRDYWQLSVDLFGPGSVHTDAEIIQLADTVLQTVGGTPEMYSIGVNHRELLHFILSEYLGLDSVQIRTVIQLLIRKPRLTHEAFVAEIDASFTPSQREANASTKLLGLLKTKTVEHLPEVIRMQRAALELKELFHSLKAAGVHSAHFDLSVVRGPDYYTGMVFEAMDENPEHRQSMLGGGRYDHLVEMFGVEPVSAVGFGFGNVTFENFLRGHKLLPKAHVETNVYVIVAPALLDKAQPVIAEMRHMGVTVAVDFSGHAADKLRQLAKKKGIRYALTITAKDLDDEQYELTNLHTGKVERHSLARTVSLVKDHRHAEPADD
ncbi:MAG TPA: ATP phosphoribosyltransferase regulatory subunit [Candidatus Saccharimonadales bacterium]|nr:ATP phosphoribosyltransferase regulatory subunit [Candidatus Saccharimonadales bacterium]